MTKISSLATATAVVSLLLMGAASAQTTAPAKTDATKTDAKAPAEFQALHLSAFARLKQPDVARLPRAAAKPEPAHKRKVYFGSAGGWVDAEIFHRDALEPGFSAAGPSVIEEYGSTTVVWPGDRFEVGELREIRIQCSSA